MKLNVLFAALVISLGYQVSGCSIFNTEPFVDAKKDASGSIVILDTPRMWLFFKNLVDGRVDSEARGGQPPGVPTWNEHWIDEIQTLECGGQENATKYVEYIIDARRVAGLPELNGYISQCN